MKKLGLILIFGTGLLVPAAPLWAGQPDAGPATDSVAQQVLDDRTIVTFEPLQHEPGEEPARPRLRQRCVVLPGNATGCEVSITGADEDAHLIGHPVIERLRGLSLVRLKVESPPQERMQVEIRHDGSWAQAATQDSRLAARSFAAAAGLPSPMMQNAGAGTGGSYVIITADPYENAVMPLADWKRRKGWPVVVATTSETGADNVAILAWLRNAYQMWPQPPEYVLLVGDVAELPSWSFSGNVSDHPYACLEGDDWLPDVMVGRFSVASVIQAEAVVAKSIAYERNPYRDEGDGWFTRSLMVAGNYGSTTPYATVNWCGQQLESIGFSPAEGVYYAPPRYQSWDGYDQIDSILEAGVSLVVYRGWALGVYGWQPPTFTVEHIPGVLNGAKLPVVMSFVCHTGDFAHADPCFGEIFLRQGTPTEAKGAVAFIGNGEHWSTTRFNDAMAYSFFERIVEPEISDLGRLMTAGKLRFLELFPLEMESAEFGESSVEFYFHIYNLLGDPELNFWKSAPRSLSVSHDGTMPAGCQYLEVIVREADGVTPVGDARVGVVQSGTLLGCAFSDTDGIARLDLGTVATGPDVQVTVTHPGCTPSESAITTGDGSEPFLALVDWQLDDDNLPPSGGNGDGLVNPGETIELSVTVGNRGGSLATGANGSLTGNGPITITPASVAFGDVPAGSEAGGLEPFVIAIDPSTEDGARIPLQLSLSHDSSTGDVSRQDLVVSAPRLQADPRVLGADGLARPGEDVLLAVILTNDGSLGTGGGTATLSLLDPAAGSISDATAVFGGVDPGATVSTEADPFDLQVAAGLAEGTGLNFSLQIVTTEGYELSTSFSVTVGRIDIGIPVGPDAYGYYAYDSADIDYPHRMPVYHWRELSPTYGGDGQQILFPLDTYLPQLQLPFTFRFYGQPVDSIRVSDNGWISFDLNSSTDWWNLPLPHPYGNGALVAPFWDNFDPMKPETDGIYWLYDAGQGTFTLQWTRMMNIEAEIEDWQTFQLVLLDPAVHGTPTGDGEILFLYKQVTNSDHLYSYASVGIEDATEQIGLQLSYSNVYAPGAAPLSPGLAVRITTAPPVYSPLKLKEFVASPIEDGVRLSWSLSDDRPISGWRLYGSRGEDWQTLGGGWLEAAARSYVDRSADPSRPGAYTLIALHPFGQQTELGPYPYAPDQDGLLQMSLHPCWPNPVHDATVIRFALPPRGTARLRIYDLSGRCVRTLLDGPAPPAQGSMEWDGRDDGGRRVAGGVYLYRLEQGKEKRTRKLLLVR